MTGPPPPSPMDRERLSLVAEIVAAVPHPGSRPAFHDRLLASLFRTLDVRRAFLALRDPGDGALRRVASRTSEDPPEGGEFRVSGTVLARSLDEGLSQRLDDALADPDLSGSESVRRLGIRSVLCVPVPVRGRPEGVLYADNRSRRASFTGEDLEFLEMIGRLTGVVLENLDHIEALDRENERLRAELRDGIEMVAASAAMEPVLRRARLAAPTDATILLTGESGTGKELLASAIHRLSARKAGPLVALNCAAIPETLLEAELFGLAPRSGIAGAPAEGREGKFERAVGGTLFLDEVGDMGPGTQARILRALQERVIERVGGGRPVPVDIRILAATNRDLERDVAEGRFRGDLYYRLQVVEIRIPPLRERGATSSPSPSTSSSGSEESASVSPRRPGRRSRPTGGRATSANCATPWSGHASSARAGWWDRSTCPSGSHRRPAPPPRSAPWRRWRRSTSPGSSVPRTATCRLRHASSESPETRCMGK